MTYHSARLMLQKALDNGAIGTMYEAATLKAIEALDDIDHLRYARERIVEVFSNMGKNE